MNFFLIQVPVYTYLFSNVLSMASKSNKDNSAHRISRSRVPVSAKISNDLAKYRSDKMIGSIDRQPLGQIQVTAIGGMTNAETKRPKRNIVKTNNVIKKISPKRSVYQFLKKPDTQSVKIDVKKCLRENADLDFKHVTLRKQRNSPLDWNLNALKDQKKPIQRASTLTMETPRITFQTRSKSEDRPSTTRIPLLQQRNYSNTKDERNNISHLVLDSQSKKGERPFHLHKPIHNLPKMASDAEYYKPISYSRSEKYLERNTNNMATLNSRSKSAERPSMIPKPRVAYSNLAPITLNHRNTSSTQLPTRSKSADRPHVAHKHEFNLRLTTNEDHNDRPSLYERMKEHLQNRTSTKAPLTSTELLRTRSESADRPTLIPKSLSISKTPTLVPVAHHNRIKNIKRSLKRPSSRELQKRTSGEADVQADTSLKTEASLLIKCDIAVDTLYISSTERLRQLTLSYERRIINYLLVSCQGVRNSPLICPVQRSVVVNWMVRLNDYQVPSSRSPQVLQVAVHHLDKVLAKEKIPIEKIQLLGAACFWLAQKQCAKPRSATTFAKSAAYAFSGVDLKTAERYILRTLMWPTIPVVAEDFVPHMAILCSPANPELLQTAATFFCNAAMLDADISCSPADVLAVAAIINSVLVLKNSGDIKGLKLCPIYRSASNSGRLRETRYQLLRMVLVMSDETCPCREPYVQYARAPLLVAPRIAAAIIELRAQFKSETAK